MASPYWALVFLAVGAELVDGITRALMPDRAELNPLSVVLGGAGSLAAKSALIAYIVFCAWVFERAGQRWLGVAVVLSALVAGYVGGLTNLGVLLA